jgi:hypothetical protein
LQRCRGSARALAFALLAVLGVGLCHAAQGDPALERRVKAAYIYRFLEFVTWPDAPPAAGDSPFIIAVAGPDEMVEELRRVAGSRSAAGRAIDIRKMDPEGRMPPLHVLFIADTERGRLAQLIRAAPRGTVIVTESDGALGLGSIINFVLVDGRVRFEIAPEAAEKRGVRLSSRLITLAQNVRGAP